MTDSLSAAASQCLSHVIPFVWQLGTRGGTPGGPSGAGRQHPVLGGPRQQCGGGRAVLAAGTKVSSLKATRTVVKLMIVREPKGAEDATEVQKKTLLVSGGFFRGQIDPSRLAVVWECGEQCE